MQRILLRNFGEKKEITNPKLKIVILLLFGFITTVITYSYISHHAKLSTGFGFEYLKFNNKENTLRILNNHYEEVLLGHLGTEFNQNSKSFECKNENKITDSQICLEWKNLRKLKITHVNIENIHCYDIKWTVSSETNITDCYELGKSNGIWFGGSVTKLKTWNLNKNNFDFQPLISGDAEYYEFSNAVRQYFINTLGVAILFTKDSRLHFSINQTSNLICFRSAENEFAYHVNKTYRNELAYRICKSNNDLKKLHQVMIKQNLWHKLNENNIRILNSVIEEPIWKIPVSRSGSSFNETTIYNYSEKIIQMGYMKLGHILVNEYWQRNIGDFTVDKNRFPTLQNIIDILHRRGFKIIFTIQPFISTESINFKYLVKHELLITERNIPKKVPALTTYKNILSAGVLDITNNSSLSWLSQKLIKIKEDYHVDYFFMDLGISHNLPYYYELKNKIKNVDLFFEIFAKKLEHIGFIGISTASFTPKPPTFLAIPQVSASWEGLQELLTYVLSYGILGFPFLMPGCISADFHSTPKQKYSENKLILVEENFSEELYIRWLQLITFMPVVQFSQLPYKYKNKTVSEISKQLTSIRHQTILPLLKKFIIKSIDETSPLIQPLWMLDSNDFACFNIYDEFAVGDELIVAPILEQNSNMREVYLPQGVWKDGIDGSLRKGSRWIHNYKVPLEKVAYFVKMPDNTRF